MRQRTNPITLTGIVQILLYALLVYRLTGIYFALFSTGNPVTADVDRWNGGQLVRPFATRVLVPMVVLGAAKVTPEFIRERIEAGTLRVPVRNVPATVAHQFHALLVLACFAGYAITMRKLLRAMFLATLLQVEIITIVSMVLMPVMFQYHNYFYDPVTLFLSTLLWLYACRREWTSYLVVFGISCFNRETTVLFLLSATLWRSSLDGWKKAFVYSGLLLGLAVVIRGGIAWWSQGIPGSIAEFHLYDHNLPKLLMFLNEPELVSCLFLGFLVFAFWKEKPLLVQLGILQLLALVVLAVVAGYVDEYRQYFECYAILVITMAYTLTKLGGMPLPINHAKLQPANDV